MEPIARLDPSSQEGQVRLSGGTRMNARDIARAAMGALCLAVALTACSSAGSDGTADPAGQDSRPGVLDPQKARTVFGLVEYRYVEVEQTEELAKFPFTEIGVAAEVLTFHPGPKRWNDAGPNSGNTLIMMVQVTDSVDGSSKPGDVVSVLLPAAGNSAEAMTKAIPPGSQAVLYLSEAQDLPQGAGTGIYAPVSPQGFVLGESDGTGVVYPLAHELVRDETLAQQLPASTK